MTTITTAESNHDVQVGIRQNPKLIHITIDGTEAVLSMDEAMTLAQELCKVITFKNR
jgi:hypothetical protein